MFADEDYKLHKGDQNELTANELDTTADSPNPQNSPKASQKEMGENAYLGIVYFVASTFFFASIFVLAKFIFIRQPDLSPLELVTYRSMIASVMMIVKLNVNIKNVMYDSVTRDLCCPLALRTFQGILTWGINFMAIKYFQLTIVAIFENFVPLIAVILAYSILGEQLRHYKVVQLIIAFFGAGLLILSTENVEDELTEEQS